MISPTLNLNLVCMLYRKDYRTVDVPLVNPVTNECDLELSRDKTLLRQAQNLRRHGFPGLVPTRCNFAPRPVLFAVAGVRKYDGWVRDQVLLESPLAGNPDCPARDIASALEITLPTFETTCLGPASYCTALRS